MPHGAGMSAHIVRTCPVYFSTRDNLPGHLAICVNNVIIMCIGLVHDIFTRNIYYGVDMKIDNSHLLTYPPLHGVVCRLGS